MSRRVNQSEFARIAQVNKSTVTRWIQSGRITLGGDGLIDVDTALRSREATESPEPRHQAMKEVFAEQRATQAVEPAPLSAEALSTAEKIGLKLKLATLKEREARAEMANLELDTRAGLLMQRSEVDFLLADYGHTLNAKLSGLADRYAPALAQHRGDVNAIHKELDDAIHDLLAELSEHLRRKQAETLVGSS